VHVFSPCGDRFRWANKYHQDRYSVFQPELATADILALVEKKIRPLVSWR